MLNATHSVSMVNDTHSKYTDYNDDNYTKTENDKGIIYIYVCIGITVVFSVFCLLGIIGNGLVIWFGIFRMKKTVNVVWFLSLAIADFSFALFLPLDYTQSLFGFTESKSVCKLIHYMLYVNGAVSILHLTVISIDRCICVKYPVWCHNHRRPRLAFIIVLIIWTFLLASPTDIIIYSSIANIDGRMICVLDIDKLRIRAFFDFVFGFLLTFIIIVSCYIMFVQNVRRKHIITSSRPVKTSVVVIIAFFICWFPRHLFIILHEQISDHVDLGLYVISTLLISISSCINPIIYVFIGRDFKEKFCGLFQLKLEKAFTEEGKLVFEKQKSCPTLEISHQDQKEEANVIT